MQKVLTAEQMREVDRLTTERYGIPSIILMENAAQAVARVITEKLGGSVKGKSVLVLCGKGNNGGDGAAVGRILQLSGASVDVVLFGRIDHLDGDAKTNATAAASVVDSFHEIETVDAWHSWFNEADKSWDVTVDAIFGSGLNRPVSGWLETVMTQTLNESAAARQFTGRLVAAVDLPSGVIADQADSGGVVFESDLTVTFTAPKPANVLASSYSLGGELIVADIGSPAELVEECTSQLFVATRQDAQRWLSETDFIFGSYKNKRGHALIIAGSKNYTGAAVLAGNAAIRSGVGLVTLAVPESSRASVVARVQPEVMVRGLSETSHGSAAENGADELNDFLKNVDAMAVGSGMSQNDETARFVRRIVEERTMPLVVDADGLTALSPWETNGPAREAFADSPPLVLTPHEGEFRKMLGVDKAKIDEILKDRVAAVRDFALQHQVILVLKGERPLIGHPDGRVVVNPTGNSGLGKAGNGDTLTGIIAGFVAQAVQMKIDIFETVVAAVYAAGLAGDIAEKKYGKRIMTASDVRECLGGAFQQLEDRP